MRKLMWGCAGILLILLLAPFAIVFAASFFNGHARLDTFSGADAAGSEAESGAVTEPLTLRIATFNIQDMLYVSRYGHNQERMRAIAAKLSTMDPDVVGFQESFVDENRQLLIKELNQMTRLKHHVYLSSGWVGSGMLISSAYPIEASAYHRFEDSNQWWKVWEGDWWAGKGVLVARVQTPAGSVDVFNTHAQADYGVPYNEQMRKKQMESMAAFISEYNAGSAVDVPAFVVGDVNCKRGEEDYEALVGGANLVRLMTIDSRIDHIFGQDEPSYAFEVLETLPIEQQVSVNNKKFGLSDHTGYLSEVRITPEAGA